MRSTKAKNDLPDLVASVPPITLGWYVWASNSNTWFGFPYLSDSLVASADNRTSFSPNTPCAGRMAGGVELSLAAQRLKAAGPCGTRREVRRSIG